MTKRILIIEDEETLRESLERVLSKEGYDITSVDSAETALDLLEGDSYDLILTDVILPGITGIELLKKVKERSPDQIVVIMTAFASLETAVESLRAGAYDYIIKPVMHEEIKQVVKNALKQGALQEENLRLREILRMKWDVVDIVSCSTSMQNIMNEIKTMRDSDENIFIIGEVGSGREFIARAIHASSNRREKPFISLNIRTIPRELFEASIFGVPGKKRERGLLEEANEGTLFIREICDLSQLDQERLFSVLKKGEITFPDAKTAIKIDVRLIAASSRDLKDLRDDLLKILEARIIRVPPLRERREDIEPLANRFVDRFSRELCKDIKGIDEEALSILANYDWPGNVRELQNVIEKAVLIARKDYIGVNEIAIR